jgi:hypothetical protein
MHQRSSVCFVDISICRWPALMTIKNSAEFYDVTSGTIDYFVNIPAGSQVQVYIADSNDDEWWSDVVSFSFFD